MSPDWPAWLIDGSMSSPATTSDGETLTMSGEVAE